MKFEGLGRVGKGVGVNMIKTLHEVLNELIK